MNTLLAVIIGALKVYARYTVSAPMMTAKRVFILPPPECGLHGRCPVLGTLLSRSFPETPSDDARVPSGSTGGQARRDQAVDPSEIGADVPLTLHRERRVAREPANEALEEPFDRRGIDQPHADTVTELRREGLGPLGELMKLVLEVFGKPRLEQIALHLLPESHDLLGHFAVLSVVELKALRSDLAEIGRAHV